MSSTSSKHTSASTREDRSSRVGPSSSRGDPAAASGEDRSSPQGARAPCEPPAGLAKPSRERSEPSRGATAVTAELRQREPAGIGTGPLRGGATRPRPPIEGHGKGPGPGACAHGRRPEALRGRRFHARGGGAPYTSATIVQTLQSQADPLSAVLTAHAGIKAALTRGAAPRAPFHWRRAERAARGGAVQIVEGAGRQRGAKPEGSGTSSSGPGRARVAADAPGLSTPCAPPPDRTGRSRPSTPSPGTPRYPSWSSRREARR